MRQPELPENKALAKALAKAPHGESTTSTLPDLVRRPVPGRDLSFNILMPPSHQLCEGAAIVTPVYTCNWCPGKSVLHQGRTAGEESWALDLASCSQGLF